MIHIVASFRRSLIIDLLADAASFQRTIGEAPFAGRIELLDFGRLKRETIRHPASAATTPAYGNRRGAGLGLTRISPTVDRRTAVVASCCRPTAYGCKSRPAGVFSPLKHTSKNTNNALNPGKTRFWRQRTSGRFAKSPGKRPFSANVRPPPAVGSRVCRHRSPFRTLYPPKSPIHQAPTVHRAAADQTEHTRAFTAFDFDSR